MTIDGHAGLLFGGLHRRSGDVSPVAHVAQVETHGLAHEHLDGHLVYGCALGVVMDQGGARSPLS